MGRAVRAIRSFLPEDDRPVVRAVAGADLMHMKGCIRDMHKDAQGCIRRMHKDA